ncbi:hypothetical protein FG386_000112 [Cryptosporidium ryanae]|uniref:uncharacterized protein n=1 Tax=Cryptosporidium ryanae TaxID=515981 RepID=UPI00351A1FD3|nr:hypothetical protein FG386_000112 [Cryptosporidium ryanae]
MSLSTLKIIINSTSAGVVFPSISRFQSLIYSSRKNSFCGVLTGSYRLYSVNSGFKARNTDFLMSKLPNGIRVATKNMGNDYNSNSVTFGLFIDSGSSKEDANTNGVAHFLEHLMFKGTHKRSKKEIESEIENMGAHLNAYTSREQTVYQARCLIDDVPKCMDILSDIIKNSRLCKQSIENEREVIVREMEEVYKSEEEAVFDDLHSEFYKDDPLGNTILGPKENIMKINRNDLISYIKSNYTPENIVILAIGNIDHEYFRMLASHYFNDIKSNVNNSDRSGVDLKTDPFERAPVVVQRKGKYDGKLHIAMGYNGSSLKSMDLPKLMLLKIILSEYSSGDSKSDSAFVNFGLKNKVVENVIYDIKKYVEFFETFNTCYKETGMFGWYIKCNSAINRLNQSEIKELAGKVHDKIKNLRENITEEELNRVKKILSYQIASIYENSLSLFDEIGRDLIINKRYIDVGEKLHEIKNINTDDMNNIIDKCFNYNTFKYIVKK